MKTKNPFVLPDAPLSVTLVVLVITLPKFLHSALLDLLVFISITQLVTLLEFVLYIQILPPKGPELNTASVTANIIHSQFSVVSCCLISPLFLLNQRT